MSQDVICSLSDMILECIRKVICRCQIVRVDKSESSDLRVAPRYIFRGTRVRPWNRNMGIEQHPGRRNRS